MYHIVKINIKNSSAHPNSYFFSDLYNAISGLWVSRSVNFLSLFALHWSLPICLSLTHLCDSTHTPLRGACFMPSQTGIQFPPSVVMISCLYWKEVMLPCLYTS